MVDSEEVGKWNCEHPEGPGRRNATDDCVSRIVLPATKGEIAQGLRWKHGQCRWQGRSLWASNVLLQLVGLPYQLQGQRQLSDGDERPQLRVTSLHRVECNVCPQVRTGSAIFCGLGENGNTRSVSDRGYAAFMVRTINLNRLAFKFVLVRGIDSKWAWPDFPQEIGWRRQ